MTDVKASKIWSIFEKRSQQKNRIAQYLGEAKARFGEIGLTGQFAGSNGMVGESLLSRSAGDLLNSRTSNGLAG